MLIFEYTELKITARHDQIEYISQNNCMAFSMDKKLTKTSVDFYKYLRSRVSLYISALASGKNANQISCQPQIYDLKFD